MKKVLAALATLCLLLAVGTRAPAGEPDRGLSPAGKSFMKEAASVDLMEVQLGRVAHDKGSSQQVRDFGDRMVLDHGKVNRELEAIAAENNLKLPAQVERKHTLMIAKLSKLSGKEFDRKYMKAMVKNSIQNIERYQKAIKKVKDQDLNAWTVATLPILQQHLQLATAVTQNLGRH